MKKSEIEIKMEIQTDSPYEMKVITTIHKRELEVIKNVEVRKAIEFLENILYAGEEDSMPDYQIKFNHWVKDIIILIEKGEMKIEDYPKEKGVLKSVR